MIFRCTIACSIVFFRLILDAWIWAICLFMKNVLLFRYFPTLCTADCKSNYKSRICCFHFANWIPIDLKKGWCEISNILSIENVQWIEHIRTNNGFCCQFQSLCWLNWFGLIWNFSKIVDESGCFFSLDLCCGFGLRLEHSTCMWETFFPNQHNFQSEPINKYRSINDSSTSPNISIDFSTSRSLLNVEHCHLDKYLQLINLNQWFFKTLQRKFCCLLNAFRPAGFE